MLIKTISRIYIFMLLAITLMTAMPRRSQADLPTQSLPHLTDEQLLTEVQKRAFRFFWDQSDPNTGLTKDRAKNTGLKDEYTVASTASTGYALASLPIAVKHGWIGREAAYQRALTTLRFLNDKMYQQHGWFYHFIDMRTGERVWNCEVSTIDTTLLIEGALVAGRFWVGTEVESLADALYDRLDWNWMRVNGGEQPEKQVVSMGWAPTSGFISSNWDSYCELMQLYFLGMGAKHDPLPAASWAAWKRNEVEYKGMKTLAGGPIFMHEMSHDYYNFKDQRDGLGWDYWVTSLNAIQINRQYCMDLASKRKTYGPDIWGLNACDAPDGYRAYDAPGDEDGTVSPTGAISAILFIPREAKAAAQAIYNRYGNRLWGYYGFGNAFNVDRDWYDKDVIGIDLGMALLSIEDVRTGLPWKLLASHPAIQRAWHLAGFHVTHEKEPRPMQIQKMEE